MFEDRPRPVAHTNGQDGTPRSGQPSTKPEARAHAWDTGLLFVLAVFAASRLLYLVSGVLFARSIPVGSFFRLTPDVPFGTLNIWSHWDGVWYVQLAERGYGAAAPASTAFFPLYPLLVRSFASLFGGPISPAALSVWAPLISLACLPLALFFVYRLALGCGGERVARGTVVCLAFFPTSFFFNAAYTESLFLALSAGSLWAMRERKDLLLACILAGMASATRNVGVFLLVPLVWEWARAGRLRGEAPDRGWGRVWRGVPYLALAPSGLLVYMGYLWSRFGDPLLFYSAQEYWNRRHAGPLTVVADIFTEAYGSLQALIGPRSPEGSALGEAVGRLHAANDAYSLLFLLFALALFGVGFRVLPLSLSLYTLLLLISAITYGKPATPLFGFSRYILVAFPLFITLATLLESRRTMAAWLTFSVILSLLFCAFFVSWRFVA